MLIGSRMLKKVEWGLVSTRTWCSGRVRQVGRTNRAPDALTHAVQILQAFWHRFQDSKFTQNLNAILTKSLWPKGNCPHFPWCAKIQEDLYLSLLSLVCKLKIVASYTYKTISLLIRYCARRVAGGAWVKVWSMFPICVFGGLNCKPNPTASMNPTKVSSFLHEYMCFGKWS